MFGLVKEFRLIEANKEIKWLKDEILKLTTTISEQSAIINDPNFIKAKDLFNMKLTVEGFEKERDSIIEECDLLIKNTKEKQLFLENESKVKADKIIKKATIDADEIKEKAINFSSEKLINIEKEIANRSRYYSNLEGKITNLNEQIQNIEVEIDNHDILSTVTSYEKLIDGTVSEVIKIKLEKVKQAQKQIIKNGTGFEISQNIYWNDSSTQGKTRQKRNGKFLITAFNSEVDNIITNTNSRNFVINAKKIEKWFTTVNKSGEDNYVRLNNELLNLRLEEHRYAFEYRIKMEMEIEEQRYIRDSIREEVKVKKEIESFIITCEKEEKSYKDELNKSISMIQSANDAEVEKLNLHISELREKLERATHEKERAMSMAQLTRSGYVYIISNKGSFGDNIYKIGMTRRLEPMDRIKELGDASVPFNFDVHALIPSDDAPTLENKLHKRFENQRVNRVNRRREYFNVTIEEIEKALNDFVDHDFNFIHMAPAIQYEESKTFELRTVAHG